MMLQASARHANRLPGARLVQRHKKRIDDSSGSWARHYRDLRDYMQPYRQRTERDDAPGAARTLRLYDSTAMVACWRGSHKLRDLLTPDFKPFFVLKPGPFVKEQAQREQLGRLLQDVSEIAQQAIQQGDFGRAADEFYQDLYAGTGCMLVLKGSGYDQLIDFIPLSAEHLELEDDASGQTRRWFYLDEIELESVTTRWPKARMPKEWQDKIDAGKGTEKVQITIACTRQERDGPDAPARYDLQVLAHKDGFELWHEELRTSCFISGRFFKIPGETRGRGPAMLAMPTVKTLNKAVEMQLKAAAFAVLGAWMVQDEGVYNPRTTRLTPGGMLKVKSTGGRKGASIANLDIPKRFDVSLLASQDMRNQIREILMDAQLPDQEGAVRSPTEIIARLRRLSEDLRGAFGRLYREIIIPLVQRVLDILDQWQLLPVLPNIDNLFVSIQVLSPLAEGQALEEAERAVRWYEMALAVLGPEQVGLVAAQERMAVWLHGAMGAPSEALLSEDERAQAKDVITKALAANANQEPPPDGQTALPNSP